MTTRLSRQLLHKLYNKNQGRATTDTHGEEMYIEIKELLKEGADANYQSKGTNPLCEASRDGQLDIVGLLMEHGADANCSDKHQCSPLYLAASHGYKNVVSALIANGADLNMATIHGYLPLGSAVDNGHIDVSEMLIDAGANVNILKPNPFGVDVFLLTYVLFGKADFSVAESLLQAGVKPHTFDFPLSHILLEYGDESRDFVKKLVYAGFNCHCENWIEIIDKKMIETNQAEISESVRDVHAFLKFEHKNAPSLQRLCRVVVRQSLSLSKVQIHLRNKIALLPLPKQVQKYVMLDYLE